MFVFEAVFLLFLIVVIPWKSSNISYGETTIKHKASQSNHVVLVTTSKWQHPVLVLHDTMLSSQSVFVQVRLTLNDTLKAGVHLVIVPGETPSALAKMFGSILTPTWTWNDP